jgi:glycosyltransferase involved in cell wall biosynthesis
VPFRELGVEFHILGGGKQLEEIQQYIAAHPDCNVFTYGFVPKEQIPERLLQMDASIVPLATRIRGAFPSKVFDILPQGLPILFCGGGEGADFVIKNEVGFSSEPGDYAALIKNIIELRNMADYEFKELSERCVSVSRQKLDFESQMNSCFNWLLLIK